MYAMGDKYGIPLLKELAREKFATILREVKNIQAVDICTFVAAISIIYNSTLSSDRGLRDAILPTLIRFKDQLRASEDFVALVMNGLGEGEFAMDLIDAWANVGTFPRRIWRCSSCDKSGQGVPTRCTNGCQSILTYECK